MRAVALISFVAACAIVGTEATQDKVGGGCWVFNQCRSGLSCHPFIQKCYHSPRKENEPCSAGYGCGSGLSCEAGSQRCRKHGQSGDPCHATRPCATGLSCHPGVHECFHHPRTLDEPCSAGYPCKSGLYCEAGVHKCRAPGKVGESCHATRICGSGLTCQPGVHKCYHNPRHENEPCSAGFGCGSGLFCEAGAQICRKPGELEDPCHATRPCKEGLSCHPGVHKCYHSPRKMNEPCSAGFGCGGGDAVKCQPFLHKCLPGDFDIHNKHTCEAMKEKSLVDEAKAAKVAITYGGGYTAAIAGAATGEWGVAYGPNGEFGCYQSSCKGYVSDASISAAFIKTKFIDFSSIAGESYVAGAGASLPFLEVGGFAQGWIFSDKGKLIGITKSYSIGVGFVPAQGSYFECTTELADHTASSTRQILLVS